MSLTPEQTALADWWQHRRPPVPLGHVLDPGVKVSNVQTYILHMDNRVQVARELPETARDLWWLLAKLQKQLGVTSDDADGF